MLVKNLDPIRSMMPLVMRGRNQSTVFHKTGWIAAEARAWLRTYNRQRGEKPNATLFHLVAYALLKVLQLRPVLNRFVSGGRIYQRKGLWLSFAAKTRFTDDAPLTTVKLSFSGMERFDDVVDLMAGAVRNRRSGSETQIEREVRFLTTLPRPLLRTILAAGRGLDRMNLLPPSLIEPDPMYTSLFLANLGSIHMDNAYHHLYEHGTCSLFGVVGNVRKILISERNGQTGIRELLQSYWSLDERITDGFYCVESLEIARRIVENPSQYVA